MTDINNLKIAIEVLFIIDSIMMVLLIILLYKTFISNPVDQEMINHKNKKS